MCYGFKGSFQKDGIVSGKARINEANYLLTYFNENYWKHILSNSTQITINKNLTLTGLINFNYINFLNTSINSDFRNLLSTDGYINSSIEIGGGTLLSTISFGSPSMTYLRRIIKYPDLSFYYSRKIKNDLLLNIEVANIFNNANRQKVIEAIGLENITRDFRRTIALTLTWTIGTRFPVMSAGDGSGIANDTKK